MKRDYDPMLDEKLIDAMVDFHLRRLQPLVDRIVDQRLKEKETLK